MLSNPEHIIKKKKKLNGECEQGKHLQSLLLTPPAQLHCVNYTLTQIDCDKITSTPKSVNTASEAKIARLTMQHFYPIWNVHWEKKL